jgi:hypothetical protein
LEAVDELASREKGKRESGEVIVFEQYVAKLDALEGVLKLEECLYVFNGLLEGYERILNKIGKTHI